VSKEEGGEREEGERGEERGRGDQEEQPWSWRMIKKKKKMYRGRNCTSLCSLLVSKEEGGERGEGRGKERGRGVREREEEGKEEEGEKGRRTGKRRKDGVRVRSGEGRGKVRCMTEEREGGKARD
jgi:hypothetical protein